MTSGRAAMAEASRKLERTTAAASPRPVVHPVAGGRRPIEVAITIDTEFSIGGAFTFPLERVPVGQQAVECVVQGNSHGLDFILDTLEAHGIRGTFFIETLQTAYFGLSPMQQFATRIVQRGHDAELHLHPEWTFFRNPDWKSRIGSERPIASCAGRQLGEMVGFIRDGKQVFEQWGIPAPVALRTGSFLTDLVVYEAMAREGLRVGSNVGFGYARPEDKRLHFTAGLHRIGRTTEIPATSYRQRLPGRSGWRVLSMTAASDEETLAILRQAHHEQVSPIVVVTHPFEFIKRRDSQFRVVRPNALTQRRLDHLCRHLAENPQLYRPVTFRERADDWAEAPEAPQAELSPPFPATLWRYVENKTNDLFWGI